MYLRKILQKTFTKYTVFIRWRWRESCVHASWFFCNAACTWAYQIYRVILAKVTIILSGTRKYSEFLSTTQGFRGWWKKQFLAGKNNYSLYTWKERIVIPNIGDQRYAFWLSCGKIFGSRSIWNGCTCRIPKFRRYHQKNDADRSLLRSRRFLPSTYSL